MVVPGEGVILQRREGVCTNIPIKIFTQSGQSSAQQRNAISMAFRWLADDGVIF